MKSYANALLAYIPLLAALLAGCGANSASNDGGLDAAIGETAVDADAAAVDSGSDVGGETQNPDPNLVAMVPLDQPAVARGSTYRGFAEQFNRYYTDPNWQPSKVIYVSPTGGGDGTTKQTPMDVPSALKAASPDTEVFFVRGAYDGCYQLGAIAGTYEQPIVLYAERDGAALGVVIHCCSTGRAACINLEGSSFVAVDGFELVGGKMGLRAVGSGEAAISHAKGNAVLNCVSHGQAEEGFFTGVADWFVIERCAAHDLADHGIYLSNGGDWNVVRQNEIWGCSDSDFQINPDPAQTCVDKGIAVDSPDCDAVAGTPGDGGRGASDFFLVEENFFHDGLAQGSNFTSTRRSIVRNNIFAVYQTHGASFWQETDNPNLGASDNQILHNLFVTKATGRRALQFINGANRNRVENNVFLGIGANMLALEVDGSGPENVFVQNYYIHATLSGRTPNDQEHVTAALVPTWFQALPDGANSAPGAWAPTDSAPFLNLGALNQNATRDRAGNARNAPTDLGPFER